MPLFWWIESASTSPETHPVWNNKSRNSPELDAGYAYYQKDAAYLLDLLKRFPDNNQAVCMLNYTRVEDVYSDYYQPNPIVEAWLQEAGKLYDHIVHLSWFKDWTA